MYLSPGSRNAMMMMVYKLAAQAKNNGENYAGISKPKLASEGEGKCLLQ